MNTSRRFENWPSLLLGFIESRRHQAFEWGCNDCCMFAADAVLAITGIDPADSLRGEYASQLSAARLLDSSGGVVGIAEAKFAALEFQSVGGAFARRGDIVLVGLDSSSTPVENGQEVAQHTLGVCFDGSILLVTADGLKSVPLQWARQAWRVD